MTTALHPASPIARRRDPATSHQAARDLTRSGERTRQVDAVLAALQTWTGASWPTSAELAAVMRTSRYMTARRLPELRRVGKVRNEKIRRCTVTGKSALTWRLEVVNATQEPLF